MDPLNNTFISDYNAVVDMMNLQTSARQNVCQRDGASPMICNAISGEMLGKLMPNPDQDIQKIYPPSMMPRLSGLF